jgi:hypothetical protein
VAIIVACDNCGDEMSKNVVSQIQFQLPEGVGMAETQFVMTMAGPAETTKPEIFHLCPECATAMLLALKTTRAKVMKGVTIWKE